MIRMFCLRRNTSYSCDTRQRRGDMRLAGGYDDNLQISLRCVFNFVLNRRHMCHVPEDSNKDRALVKWSERNIKSLASSQHRILAAM